MSNSSNTKITLAVLGEKIDNFMEYSKEHHMNHDIKLEEINKRVKLTNGKVITNTEFRHKAQATISMMKWLIGLIGITNFAIILNAFVR